MKTCQNLFALVTVILFLQVRSQDPVEVKALSSEEFVPFGGDVWLNCSTPYPNITHYESRLRKNITLRGATWIAVQIIVDDWQSSTLQCLLHVGGNLSKSNTIVMAYALASNVTIDMDTELEEEKEHTINCTVYDVAPLEFLTINIRRGEEVIDSKSYEGPHVVDKRTVIHHYTFNASRNDNHMNFSCMAVLQLGSQTYISNSSEIHAMTYTLPDALVLTVPNFIENGTSFTAECLVANGFPTENIELEILIGDRRINATSVRMSEGAVKGTFELNAAYSSLGPKDIFCEAHLSPLFRDTTKTVIIYELPDVTLALSENTVDLEDNVTATCEITNYHPGLYGLVIKVDDKEEVSTYTSKVADTVTASKRTPSLPVVCTAYINGNLTISRSSTQILEVQYSPEFTESLCPSVSLAVEGKTPFSCRADGNPTPIVECSVDEHFINDTVMVTRDMSGIYTCRATNQKGNVTKAVNLTVQYAPVSPTVTVSVNSTVKTGDPLNITCKSDGLPAPTYSWRIPNDAEVIYSTDKSAITIYAAAWTHNGEYTCVARNAHGEAEAKQEVAILPDEVNIGLIVGVAIGVLVLTALITSVWYVLWKKGRKGFYELLRPSHRQCHQNGNIPSETPTNNTSSV